MDTLRRALPYFPSGIAWVSLWFRSNDWRRAGRASSILDAHLQRRAGPSLNISLEALLAHYIVDAVAASSFWKCLGDQWLALFAPGVSAQFDNVPWVTSRLLSH